MRVIILTHINTLTHVSHHKRVINVAVVFFMTPSGTVGNIHTTCVRQIIKQKTRRGKKALNDIVLLIDISLNDVCWFRFQVRVFPTL